MRRAFDDLLDDARKVASDYLMHVGPVLNQHRFAVMRMLVRDAECLERYVTNIPMEDLFIRDILMRLIVLTEYSEPQGDTP